MKIDPNAKLIYNDNKAEGAGLSDGRSRKADAMYDMLKGKPDPPPHTPRPHPPSAGSTALNPSYSHHPSPRGSLPRREGSLRVAYFRVGITMPVH